jgi:hypothetical protein
MTLSGSSDSCDRIPRHFFAASASASFFVPWDPAQSKRRLSRSEMRVTLALNFNSVGLVVLVLVLVLVYSIL